ncbi:hypothetical protein SDRG_15893 [Saprolegnia diclina VS20]|uniref:Uncharacterized protein n=1 Tax=Saprolegnia diclina (strain VS20) TaxID=1156394 RepID=T0PVK3_SAPDV|nr:hypothetical protein SDRG_15893 [Saprolegnia diclina VS20]EQC26306.1 hypothetical protein SDRG_15893 [Saprolegnia diclina VS20]|eukprot:XP_008620301.1 hypothetical protein SDRG_15893 [Saprolegnia diclina VS20]
MRCAVDISAPAVSVAVLDARFVLAAKATLSFADDAQEQSLVYSRKTLRDAEGNEVATLRRTTGVCSTSDETFLVESALLAQPAEIVNTTGWSWLTLTHTWRLDDHGSALRIAGRFYSSNATISVLLPTREVLQVATASRRLQTVTLERGVDAAAVLLLCRTWSHAQRDLMASTLVAVPLPIFVLVSFFVAVPYHWPVFAGILVLEIALSLVLTARFRG